MHIYLQYHELVTFLNQPNFNLSLPNNWSFELEKNLLFQIMILFSVVSGVMFFIISLTSCLLRKDDKNMKHLLTGFIVTSFAFTVPMIVMFAYVLIKINNFIGSAFEIQPQDYWIDVKPYLEYYRNIIASQNKELIDLMHQHKHIVLFQTNTSSNGNFVIQNEHLVFSPQYLIQYKLDVQTIQTKYILINSITFGLRIISMLFVLSNTIRLKMQSRKESKRQKEIEVQEPILINQNPHIMR